MSPRDRYILDHVPTLLAAILSGENGLDGTGAITVCTDLIGALYDQVMSDEAIPVGATLPRRDGLEASCPHQDIIALYHELLPLCPRVRSWTSQRQALLRSRWREHPDMDWWRGYLSHVAESAFLTGRAPPAPGRLPFLADLEWLVRPANMARVYEGKYHG